MLIELKKEYIVVKQVEIMDNVTLLWIFLSLVTPLYPIIITFCIRILREVNKLKEEVLRLRVEFNNHIKYLHNVKTEEK